MQQWNVYITRMLPEPAINLLKEHCNVEINLEDRALSKEELLMRIKKKEAVICLLSDIIDEDVIIQAPKVKIYANYAVGYDNIDVKAATKRGIWVTNTPGVLTDTTAELAWALLFSVARRIVEADKFTRNGNYRGWAPMLFLGVDITGKTLGIIGSGRIGTAFGKKAKGFEMKILYYDLKRNLELEQETGAIFVDKETLLKESDFVSIHVPLMAETKHFLSETEFKLMKQTAILINTSRGPVVDEIALIRALKEKQILGAGLDVYEWEPKLTFGLTELDNVVLAPHIASASIETRTKMAFIAVENILAAMQGKVPPNCVKLNI